MEAFYEQELGNVLMPDVGVSYNFGDVGVLDSTIWRFPIFTAGSKIVVQGRMDSAGATVAAGAP